MRFFQAGCETSMIEALPSIFLAFLVGLHSWTTTEYHFLKETWKLGKGPLKDELSQLCWWGWMIGQPSACLIFCFSTYPDNLRLCISLVTSLLSISYLSLATSIIFHHAMSYICIHIHPLSRQESSYCIFQCCNSSQKLYIYMISIK